MVYLGVTSSKQLAASIRAIIDKVERISGLSHDDPSLVALRNIFKRRLREVKRAKGYERPPVPDWTLGSRRLRRP